MNQERPEPARDLAEDAHGEPVGPAPDVVDDDGITRRIELRPRHEVTGEGAPPPVTAPRRVNTESEWFWPVVSLAGVAIVIFVNWLANAIPFNGQTTGEVLEASPVWYQPAGWAFGIWGLIYLLLLVFAIYALFPAGRRNPWVQRTGPWLLVANLANVSWLVLWHWERYLATLVLMAILLLSLIGLYATLHWRRTGAREASRAERILAWPAFSIYLGWVTVAMLANLSVYWDRAGWDGGPFSLRVWAIVLLVIGAAAGAGMAFLRRDGWYPLVLAFASVAIAVEQWDRSHLVSVVAVAVAVIEVLLAVAALMLAFDRRAMLGPGAFSTRREEPPPPETPR